jgi:N-acetylglucosaminyldiphosphoundecaprenol N-acetyl-beta-D-mannosaminyltransferase
MKKTLQPTASLRSNFTDYSLFLSSLDDLPVENSLLINTLNQYSYCIAQKDIAFRKSLLRSDVLLPDGIAVVAAARFLTGQRFKKIAGAEVHSFLLNYLNEKSGSCFYVGSSESTLRKIKDNLFAEYPGIRVGTFSPPYKAEFTSDENQQIIDTVNSFKPDILFVGMTAPKQEKWVHLFNDQLNTKIICTIGAVFDFYAGTVKRPSKMWVDCGLEWFVRLVKEPRRMWKRYLYYGPIFIYYIVKEKVLIQFKYSHEAPHLYHSKLHQPD